MANLAVVGSGISGLVCAHYLSRSHTVTLFEASNDLGGHTHTVTIDRPSGKYAVDTGFIVFNDWTYPNFIRILQELGVEWQDSEMGFSVKSEKNGLEYAGKNFSSLFVQKKNYFNIPYVRMLLEILRFNRECLELLATQEESTLGEYLQKKNYSEYFQKHYILAMGGAIWSSSLDQMLQFPARFFVQFFKNHGMLSVNERPTWRVLKGGSRTYLEPITRPFRDRIFRNAPVEKIIRREKDWELRIGGKKPETRIFDLVVVATHSDQALRMREHPTPQEVEILGQFPYQDNHTILHTDESVLPRSRKIWSAWNYLLPLENRAKIAVTYHMNILQSLKSPESYLVSLNLKDKIRPEKILQEFHYRHPVYHRETPALQKRWAEISNAETGIYYAGAYWGYGFHEDGVNSAIRVIKELAPETWK